MRSQRRFGGAGYDKVYNARRLRLCQGRRQPLPSSDGQWRSYIPAYSCVKNVAGGSGARLPLTQRPRPRWSSASSVEATCFPTGLVPVCMAEQEHRLVGRRTNDGAQVELPDNREEREGALRACSIARCLSKARAAPAHTVLGLALLVIAGTRSRFHEQP